MPIKSAKQFRLMEGAAHGDSKLKSLVPPDVAAKFLKETPKKKKSIFAKASR